MRSGQVILATPLIKVFICQNTKPVAIKPTKSRLSVVLFKVFT